MVECIIKPWSSDAVKCCQRPVREEVKDKKSPLQAWILFFTKIMLDIIVVETNRKIEETMMQLQDYACGRYGFVRLTNPSEELVLVGIVAIM